MERVHGFKGELFQKYHDIEIVYTHTMENDYIDVDFDFLRVKVIFSLKKDTVVYENSYCIRLI